MTRYQTKKNGEVEVDITWEKVNGNLEMTSYTVSSTEGKAIHASICREIIPSLPVIVKMERAKQEKEHLSKAPALSHLIKRGGDSRRDLSEEDLTSVAILYRHAYSQGLPIQKTIAKEMGIAIPTAARRIMRARQEGFLEPRLW